MNYAEIKYYDIANGPGVRTSLFVSRMPSPLPRLLQPGSVGLWVWQAL